MRHNLQASDAHDFKFQSGRLGAETRILAGDISVSELAPVLQFYSCGGANREIQLHLPRDGAMFFIVNTDASYSITVKNELSATLLTLEPGYTGQFFSNSDEWKCTRSWANLDTFGPVGASHKKGLVPDPGPTAGPAIRFLGDDGLWHGAFGNSLLDGYSFITDGTNSAAGTGNDTFRLRSANSSITITVTNNDATFGDVGNFVVNEANVNHNLLLNYVADQHVAHSGVSISAGTGLSGGGTIDASRTLSLGFSSLSAQTVVAADEFAFWDASLATHSKVTFTNLNATLAHDSLSGYVASRHVDHSSVAISAGTGLSGGGNIDASRTISLNVNGLATTGEAVVAGDFFPLYDVSQVGHYKVSFATLNATLDHNALLNYSANQHIDHSTVSITAGTGLTGGGTINASRTLSIANNGVSNVMLRPSLGKSVIGRSANSTGSPDDIVATNEGDLLQLVGGVLAFAPSPASLARVKLTGPRTYFVRTTGNDSNDGLSIGSPKLTGQSALNDVSLLDFNGQTVTIDFGDGTFNGHLSIGRYVGCHVFSQLVIQGTGTGCILQGTVDTAGTIQSSQVGAVATIRDLKIQHTQTNGRGILAASGLGTFFRTEGTVAFGTLGSAGIALRATLGARLTVSSGFSWDTNLNTVISIDDQATCVVSGTVTTTGSRTVTQFVSVSLAGRLSVSGATFSGTSVTGTRFNVASNGILQATSDTQIPGSVAGTESTQGQRL